MATPGDAPKTVREAMHAGVVTCPPEATLRSVAALLAEHRIHAVVVASEDEDAARGVVTDRDVIWSFYRGDLDRVAARDAATEPTVTVRPDAELRHAAELMNHYGTSHLIVTESAGGRPVGILSSLDVAAAAAGPPR